MWQQRMQILCTIFCVLLYVPPITICRVLMPIFANPYPKAHEEESLIKIMAQRPTKKTKEQERSKEGI